MLDFNNSFSRSYGFFQSWRLQRDSEPLFVLEKKSIAKSQPQGSSAFYCLQTGRILIIILLNFLLLPYN